MQKKSLIATAAIFCCRFTGLLREVCFTSLFGATGALDSFLTAFRIPNMLRDMFAEGALSQSFTSEMSKVQHAEGSERAWQMAQRVSTQLMTLMICFVSLGVLSAGWLMQQLYPERAAIVLSTTGGSEAETVAVSYQGTTKNLDGGHEIHLQSTQQPIGWSNQSYVTFHDLPTYTQGEQLHLSAKQLNGELKIEPRNYVAMAAQLCRVMWPFILFASLSALAMGALNVFGIFGLPNLASAVFNLTTISVGLLLGWLIDPHFGPDALYGFAIAILCGGLLQLLLLLPRLRKEGFRPRIDLGLRWDAGRLHFSDQSARKVWVLMIPGMIAAGITQFNIFINTSFALDLPSGSVTALSSAFHLWQLPVALFGVAVGMVVLPTVSLMTVNKESANRDIAHHLALAMRFLAFFAMPSGILLALWGEEIVSVFYQRGRFDAQASAMTGQVLSAYSIGLLSYAGTKVLQPVFLALERPWPPAMLALICCATSIGLNYFFVYQMHYDAPWLALTTSCVTTLNFAFYFFYLRHLLGGMDLNTLLPGLLRIACAGCVLALACYGMKEAWMAGFTTWSFVPRMGMLSLMGIGAGILYIVTSYIFRVPELVQIVDKIRHRTSF